MKYNLLRNLDDSLKSFELIKNESEKLWKDHLDNPLHIQEGSKWNKGLTEEELISFQYEMGFEFPRSLKNYYRTMNGLDKPGIRYNYHEDENEPYFFPVFPAYPNDIELIKTRIGYVIEDNNITEANNAPKLFPSHSHRFLIIDQDGPVLSMVGKDIIYWAEGLAKSIAYDIFQPPWKKMNNKMPKPSFWTDKII